VPSDQEKLALLALKETLSELSQNNVAVEEVQTAIFTVGKAHNYENLRDWFGFLYETLLGQKQGPRMGSFCVLYGLSKTILLIDTALQRS